MPDLCPGPSQRLLRGVARGCLAALLCLAPSGCVERIMLDGMIHNVRHTEGGIETVHDFEMARQMSESNLGLLEGLYRLDPEDDDVTYMLARGWATTAARFMLDAHEAARAAGNGGVAVYQRTRLRAAFLRARFYAERWLVSRDEDFGASVGDPARLREWLEDEVDDEEDSALLLWAGLAWAGHTLASDKPDAKELSIARIMLERSVALDETVEHGLGHVLLALDRAAHGDTAARQHSGRAVELSQGRSLQARLASAVVGSCLGGSAPAFQRALDDVIRAGDPLPDARLENLIAQQRARRYRAAPAIFGTCPVPKMR